MIYLKNSSLKIKSKKTNDFNVRSLSFFVDYLTYLKFKKVSNKNRKTIIATINANKFETYDDIFKNNLFDKESKNLKQIIPIYNELIVYSKKISKVKYWFEKDYKEQSTDDAFKYIELHKQLEDLVREELKTEYSGFYKKVNKYLFTTRVH